MEAITAESADNSAPAERYSAAIARELEKVRVEAAARDARFASFRVRPPEAQRVTEAEWLASHDQPFQHGNLSIYWGAITSYITIYV